MIEFLNVEKSYTTGIKAIDGVSMCIDEGEFVFLTGPSGSGKSTIVGLISGELRATSGDIRVSGYSLRRIRKRDIPYLRKNVGVVYQNALRLIPTKTAYENLAFVMRLMDARERDIRDRVPYVLEVMDLHARIHSQVKEMSNGERQRLAIARAWVNNPSIIIADEPTDNLDPVHATETMTILREINNLGSTVLVATRDMETARRIGKRVLTLNGGRLVSDTDLDSNTT